MLRKFLLILTVFIILFVLTDLNLQAQQRPSPPPKPGTEIELGRFPVDTSRHGLQLVKGFVTGIYPIKVGTTIKVYFVLKNVSGRDINFGSNGVFVGARWNSTTDANNRDFGHQYRNYTLRNGQAITLNASITVNEAGTWRFWPAYNIGNGYGPFRWHEVVVEVGM
ncbi:hypothetical protein [Thermodesulfovibrio sp.]|uniref:hypothetical protein n=1 Tax=Thermodesulfovibrio sp. TaxID=2067987 RepID=UPI0030B00CF2